MALGQHKIEFEVLEGWDRLPAGWSYVEVAGVACDSQDRVYVFNRGAHPVIVFDEEGKFLNACGEGLFKSPHDIFIDRETASGLRTTRTTGSSTSAPRDRCPGHDQSMICPPEDHSPIARVQEGRLGCA
jgi:hypothetical protein